MQAEEGVALAVVAGLVFFWSLIGRRAERATLTAPIVFMAAGALLVAGPRDGISPEGIRWLAELTLVVVLFHDASTVRLSALRRDPWVPVRLLAIGFPLALALTTVSTLWLLPAASLAGAVLIAGAITPTDAGLGAPTILNPVVPVRVRRALNVESGLNDGLATPVVLGALSVLVSTGGGEEETVLSLAAVPVLIAIAIAAGVGLGGALLLDRSRARVLSSERARAIAIFMLPLVSFGLAEMTHANAFIAAFVAGLAFGRFSRCVAEEEGVTETLEISADLLSLVLWFLAGALIVNGINDGFRWQWAVLAVGALTVLRMVPVAIALLGTGFKWPTVAFLGWFGPRGIATIVFGLIAVEDLREDPALETYLADVSGVLGLTVALSVVLHGVTAGPLSNRYGAWVARVHGPIESEPSIEPMPGRGVMPQSMMPPMEGRTSADG